MFEQYNGEMSIRDWIEAHPDYIADTDVAEGIIKIRPLKGIFEDEN